MSETWCSKDDIDLLRRLAAGQSVGRIAVITDTSPRLVRDRVREVRGLLGATTNIHAVVLAVRRGII